MAENKQTYLFFSYVLDHTGPDIPARRREVRETHLKNAKVRPGAVMRLGGALVDPATYQSIPKKVIGSAAVFESESLETLRKWLEEDIYNTSGVWNKDTLVILPWMPAMPLPPIAQD